MDVDLKAIFTAEESIKYKTELVNENNKVCGEPVTENNRLGKLQSLMDVKATGHDRQSVLGRCEFGEDAQKSIQMTHYYHLMQKLLILTSADYFNKHL
jgi:hypothetical protein